MSEIILSQAYDIFIMWAGGMTAMLLRDVLDWFQWKSKPSKAVAFCQDILFWILAAVLASSFLYYCAYGLVSVHAVGAFCIGAAFWKASFGKRFLKRNPEKRQGR